MHDERHFVETYSLRQNWEVDLHPEEACGGPLDLHLALEVDPGTLLSFEDLIAGMPEDEDPPDSFHFPLVFNWALPPLPKAPDLLILATELAGIGGTDLPLEVSAIDSFPSVTDAPERSLAIVSRVEVSLTRVFMGQEQFCDVLDTLPASAATCWRTPPAGWATTPSEPSGAQAPAAEAQRRHRTGAGGCARHGVRRTCRWRRPGPLGRRAALGSSVTARRSPSGPPGAYGHGRRGPSPSIPRTWRGTRRAPHLVRAAVRLGHRGPSSVAPVAVHHGPGDDLALGPRR